MSVAIQTSQNVLLEYEPASLGDRILATLIDYLVFFGWLLLTIMLPVAVLHLKVSTFYYALVVFLPILTYDLLCEWLLNGQSLGKIAMNIRVVMLDGSQPGLGAYLLRWLMRLVDTAIMTGLIAMITIAVNGRGQRLGDIAAGTTVVKLTHKVSLQQLLYQPLPDGYEVIFPEAGQLLDRDIQIIRDVLSRGDEGVVQRTADKVKSVLGAQSMQPARRFLETIVTDHQFLALKD